MFIGDILLDSSNVDLPLHDAGGSLVMDDDVRDVLIVPLCAGSELGTGCMTTVSSFTLWTWVPHTDMSTAAEITVHTPTSGWGPQAFLIRLSLVPHQLLLREHLGWQPPCMTVHTAPTSDMPLVWP